MPRTPLGLLPPPFPLLKFAPPPDIDVFDVSDDFEQKLIDFGSLNASQAPLQKWITSQNRFFRCFRWFGEKKSDQKIFVGLSKLKKKIENVQKRLRRVRNDKKKPRRVRSVNN